MKSNEINWKSGRVLFWDLDFLDATKPLDAQVSDLKEDLAQVVYYRNTDIDVGWYPSFDESGSFMVTVREGGEMIRFRAYCKTVEALKATIEMAVDVVEP